MEFLQGNIELLGNIVFESQMRFIPERHPRYQECIEMSLRPVDQWLLERSKLRAQTTNKSLRRSEISSFLHGVWKEIVKGGDPVAVSRQALKMDPPPVVPQVVATMNRLSLSSLAPAIAQVGVLVQAPQESYCVLISPSPLSPGDTCSMRLTNEDCEMISQIDAEMNVTELVDIPVISFPCTNFSSDVGVVYGAPAPRHFERRDMTILQVAVHLSHLRGVSDEKVAFKNMLQEGVVLNYGFPATISDIIETVCVTRAIVLQRSHGLGRNKGIDAGRTLLTILRIADRYLLYDYPLHPCGTVRSTAGKFRVCGCAREKKRCEQSSGKPLPSWGDVRAARKVKQWQSRETVCQDPGTWRTVLPPLNTV